LAAAVGAAVAAVLAAGAVVGLAAGAVVGAAAGAAVGAAAGWLHAASKDEPAAMKPAAYRLPRRKSRRVLI
jgi:hypothetical protein